MNLATLPRLQSLQIFSVAGGSAAAADLRVWQAGPAGQAAGQVPGEGGQGAHLLTDGPPARHSGGVPLPQTVRHKPWVFCLITIIPIYILEAPLLFLHS